MTRLQQNFSYVSGKRLERCVIELLQASTRCLKGDALKDFGLDTRQVCENMRDEAQLLQFADPVPAAAIIQRLCDQSQELLRERVQGSIVRGWAIGPGDSALAGLARCRQHTDHGCLSESSILRVLVWVKEVILVARRVVGVWRRVAAARSGTWKCRLGPYFLLPSLPQSGHTIVLPESIRV